MAVIVCTTAVVGFVTCCFLAYRKIRPQFPVRVNCWFCSQDTKVPYGNRSCWDCPNCEQYNGFTADGDFNKPVPAQYTEVINHPISCEPTEFLSRGEFFCPSCQRNQLLKIKQLASFEPLNEATYDEEVSFYKRHLESVYALCPTCETAVREALKCVDETLKHCHSSLQDRSLPSYEPNRNTKVVSKTENSLQDVAVAQPSRNMKKYFSHLCTVSTLLCALLLLLTELCHDVPKLRKFLHGKPCQRLQNNIWTSAASSCGLAVCIMSKLLLGKDRLFFRDAIHILMWLTAVISSMPESVEIISVVEVQGVHLHAMVAVLLMVQEFIVVMSSRHPTNVTAPIIKRLALDGNSSSIHSETVSEAVSSISTSRRRQLVTSDNEDKASPHSQLKASVAEPLRKVKEASEKSFLTCGGKQPLKTELDTLEKDLSGFWIGRPPSESGYSTGTGNASSSAFGQSTFAPPSSSGFGAGVAFPRPLISPARLGHVKFSTATGKSMLRNNVTSKMITSSQLGQMHSGRHYNIFLAQESRPHSMFTQKNLPKEIFTYSMQPNGTDKENDSFGKASSFGHHGVQPGMWLPKQPQNEKTQQPCGIFQKQHINKSLWRDSSDVMDDAEDDKPAVHGTKLTKKRLDDMECDSTTPSVSLLMKKMVSQHNVSRVSDNFFQARDCTELSDDEDEAPVYHKGTPSQEAAPVKSKTEFSRWLVFSAMIAVVSMVTNLLLAWSVLSSQ